MPWCGGASSSRSRLQGRTPRHDSIAKRRQTLNPIHTHAHTETPHTQVPLRQSAHNLEKKEKKKKKEKEKTPSPPSVDHRCATRDTATLIGVAPAVIIAYALPAVLRLR